MIYNSIGMNGSMGGGIQQTAKQPLFLAALAAVDSDWLLIGVGGLVLCAMFASGKKDKKKSPPAVEKEPAQQLPDSFDPYESMTEKELQKELIRQAMSELGKRRGAARARKRQQ